HTTPLPLRGALPLFDLPAWLTMARVIRRLAASYGRVRPDSTLGCPERLDIEFLRYVWTWNRGRRARNLALIERFPGKVVILASRDRTSTRLNSSHVS